MSDTADSLSRKILRPIVTALSAALVGACLAVFVKQHGAWHTESLWRVGPGLAAYLTFGIYWDVAAKKASSLLRSESRPSSSLHQILIAVSVLLIILRVPGLEQRVLPSSYVLVVIGLGIELCGIVVAIWARVVLGSSWSRSVAITQDHRLVREGPYACVRHPIYAGALLIYVGLTIAVGRLHAVLGLVLVCLAYWRKVTMEERILNDTYGVEFEDYQRNSWLLIPHFM